MYLFWSCGVLVAMSILRCTTVMWNLGSLTRDRTHVPCIGRRGPKHWEVPEKVLNVSLAYQIFV